jgi:branched-chain amino acid transport system substrate-binding protein
MFKKAYLLFFAAVLLAGCSGGESNTIKIGCASPLTGDQAQMGIDACNGVRLAVEQANAKGIGIPGQKFEVLALDDQHNPAQAVNVAKKLAADPSVLAVMGHFNSSCSKPAGAIYHEARMVQVTAASTNPELSKQGFDTFFRVSATDDVQGPSGAKYAAEKLGAKSIFIIDDKTTYGKGLADEFEKEARKLGVQILGHEGITQGDKDFTPLLTKIKPLNPDVIYFGGIYPEGALLIRQARSLNLTSKMMGGDGIADPLFSKLASAEIAEGTYATMVGGDMRKVDAAQGFIKAYEEKFGPLGLWSAYAYDAGNILIQAIAKAGTKDREAVLKAMREIPDFQGVTGKIVFDEKGDNKNQFIGMFHFHNGQLEYVGPTR